MYDHTDYSTWYSYRYWGAASGGLVNVLVCAQAAVCNATHEGREKGGRTMCNDYLYLLLYKMSEKVLSEVLIYTLVRFSKQ